MAPLVVFASPFHGGGFEFDPGRSELHQLLRGGRRSSKVHVPGLEDISFQAFPGGILRIELSLERLFRSLTIRQLASSVPTRTR